MQSVLAAPLVSIRVKLLSRWDGIPVAFLSPHTLTFLRTRLDKLHVPTLHSHAQGRIQVVSPGLTCDASKVCHLKL